MNREPIGHDEPASPGPEPFSASGDRGISPVAGPMGGRRGRMIGLAAIAIGCTVFLAASWDRGEDANADAGEVQAPPRELTPFEPARRTSPPRTADADQDPSAPRLSDEEIIPPIADDGLASASSGGPTPQQTRQALAESARRAPLLAYSHAETRSNLAADVPVPAISNDATSLQMLRRDSPVEQAAAGRLGDRNLLITAGSTIPCVLQTAMDSTTPGYVSCVLPGDIYSDNGAVVLLERGTRVLGEYRGGLQQGRRRLFVLWTRAVTPAGVTVALASPAADALGRSGFDGTVDAHFWERFGGALLLSLVDHGAYAAAGSGDHSGGLARQPSDAAAEALQGTIDVPPTLRKAQGSEVSIFVARDLDFRAVYRLAVR